MVESELLKISSESGGYFMIYDSLYNPPFYDEKALFGPYAIVCLHL